MSLKHWDSSSGDHEYLYHISRQIRRVFEILYLTLSDISSLVSYIEGEKMSGFVPLCRFINVSEYLVSFVRRETGAMLAPTDPCPERN